MQPSYTSLHLHSPILRPCRRKQNCFEAATAAIGTRYPWRRRWLGHKITTPGFFSKSTSQKQRVRLRGGRSSASPFGVRSWLLRSKRHYAGRLTAPLGSWGDRGFSFPLGFTVSVVLCSVYLSYEKENTKGAHPRDLRCDRQHTHLA